MSMSLRTLLLAGLASASALPAWAGQPAFNNTYKPSGRPTVSRTATPVRPTAARQEAAVPAASESAASGPKMYAEAAPAQAFSGSGCASCAGGHVGRSYGNTGATAPSMRETYSGKNPPTVWDRLKYKYNHYWKPGLQESHWGYPELFGERPAGYHVYAHAKTQVANAEGARMMLYEYDFDQDKDTLNARGEQQLEKIALLAGKNFFPIVVAPTPIDPALADRRRERILKVLEASNFPIPPERIIVARPLTPGVYDWEPESVLTVGPTGANTGRLGTITTNGGATPFQTMVGETTTGQ